MVVRNVCIVIWIALVILGATGCGSGTEAKAETTIASPTTITTSNQADTGSKGTVVEVVPMSETELTTQPPGQSEPGTSAGSGDPQKTAQVQTEQPESGTVTTYTNSIYAFSVDHPANFILRTQTAEKLSELKPRPVASFIFMNPITASSDVPDLEPADLEIRLYTAERVESLDSWLIANRLLPADGTVPSKPFQTTHISGVQVCASTMIAPGCSSFVMSNGWIYQLIPATVVGETMITTFRLKS